jgi:hypothetical protein
MESLPSAGEIRSGRLVTLSDVPVEVRLEVVAGAERDLLVLW